MPHRDAAMESLGILEEQRSGGTRDGLDARSKTPFDFFVVERWTHSIAYEFAVMRAFHDLVRTRIRFDVGQIHEQV